MLAPADVLQELLDGPVQDEAPPHDGGVLVGQEPHGDDLDQTGPDGQLQGEDLAGLVGPELALSSRASGAPRSPRCRRRGGRR